MHAEGQDDAEAVVAAKEKKKKARGEVNKALEAALMFARSNGLIAFSSKNKLFKISNSLIFRRREETEKNSEGEGFSQRSLESVTHHYAAISSNECRPSRVCHEHGRSWSHSCKFLRMFFCQTVS